MRIRTTPLSENKTQALSRALTFISRGYIRSCTGLVTPSKLPRLISKFDVLYAVGATRGERVTRQRDGLANVALAVYFPPEKYLAVGEKLPWMLLATPGDGVEAEVWTDAEDRPSFVGYELVRHNHSGKVRWTWRRPKSAMSDLYAELSDHLNRHQHVEVKKLLERIAHQPGFHGVRDQSQRLCDYARAHGYEGPVPTLYYIKKMPHGQKHVIEPLPPASGEEQIQQG